MKTNNNKGFTLIELIMVIVILGILAAVAVPKFFSITTEAHTKSQEAFIGNLKSALNLYAANELVAGNGRTFPLQSTADLFAEVLEGDMDADWSWTVAGDDLVTTSGILTYTGGPDDVLYYYHCTTGGTSYTIDQTAP